MADVTRCTICGQRPEAPVHSTPGGHQFQRLEVWQDPDPDKKGPGLLIFLAAAIVVFALAFFFLG